MSKTAAAVKTRVGRPPHDVSPPKPMPWESKAFAKRVDDILNSLEVPQVDAEVRRYFQRTLYLSDHFGGGGRE